MDGVSEEELFVENLIECYVYLVIGFLYMVLGVLIDCLFDLVEYFEYVELLC